MCDLVQRKWQPKVSTREGGDWAAQDLGNCSGRALVHGDMCESSLVEIYSEPKEL